jgi:hypothetical protein
MSIRPLVQNLTANDYDAPKRHLRAVRGEIGRVLTGFDNDGQPFDFDLNTAERSALSLELKMFAGWL